VSNRRRSSTETGCAHAIEIARERFGTIEALVNNAGIGMSAIRPDAEVSHPSIEELTPEIWDRFFAIFVRAPVILTRLALPLMREARFGRIVNNTTSYRTMLRVLPYGSAKAAPESMSAVWAKELEGSPISECAGAGRTDRHTNDLRSVGMAARKNAAARNHGTAYRLAVSDASADFNGQRITAARWDPSLPPAEAAKRSSRPIGWPELAADAVWLIGEGT